MLLITLIQQLHTSHSGNVTEKEKMKIGSNLLEIQNTARIIGRLEGMRVKSKRFKIDDKEMKLLMIDINVMAKLECLMIPEK